MCGICVADQSVYSSVEATYCAITPRGSIAFGMSRCWRKRSFTVTGALSKISSTPPASSFHVKQWFVPNSSWRIGASSASAASGSITAGSGS